MQTLDHVSFCRVYSGLLLRWHPLADGHSDCVPDCVPNVLPNGFPNALPNALPNVFPTIFSLSLCGATSNATHLVRQNTVGG